ncbi:clathrin interactor 1 isoform X2 [Hydra vulgaris]|uniref:clathrin interactor 1 isoform X2 n=1 Tax=Hydra vulgaris TaxID=6087 RepID=UPI0001926655|nr:clathrin interactor 1 isoform X2 [Hydra vulgaris]
MWKIREIQDKVTNVVMNYTEVETKVREATNDDQWGPHGTIMNELAKFTYTYEHFPEVMGMLWKRLLLEQKYWRRVYKSLLLLRYLITNGSERVVTSARDHLFDMRQLESYQHIDELGKDQGLNIRHKVKEIIDLIQDDARLRDERKRSKVNKDKYVGMSSNVIEDSFYSDKYSRDMNTSQSRIEYDDDFNRKTTFQQIKDTIESIRPGKRDYSEYNTKPSRQNVYQDEPEVEEATEDYKSGDEDSYQFKIPRENSISNKEEAQPSQRKSTTPKKIIDLGASANLGASQTKVMQVISNDEDKEFSNFNSAPISTVAAAAVPVKPSVFDDLADVLTAPLSYPALTPMNAISNEPQGDLFGDFSLSSQNTNINSNDFANFNSFDSFNQPTVNSGASFGQFETNYNNQTIPMMPQTHQTFSTHSMPQNNYYSPQHQLNIMTPSVMQQTAFIGQTNTMQPNYQASPFSNSPNTVSATSPLSHQSNVNSDKKNLWSNSGGVDISLDYLKPGVTRPKAPLPSMNQMSNNYSVGQQQPGINWLGGQSNIQQQNLMMNNNMSNLGMHSSTVRMQNMSPVRSNIGMSTNMGMPTNMGMSIPTHMGQNKMVQPIGMQINMQPTSQQINFAQFKAS